MTSSASTSPAIVPAASGPGFGWRVAVSISTFFGWLSFVLLYFAFWAHRFTGLQSAIVILVSLLVFIAVNGATWAPWGSRFAPAHRA